MNEHAKFLREESDAAMADDCPVASNGLKRAAAEIERLNELYEHSLESRKRLTAENEMCISAAYALQASVDALAGVYKAAVNYEKFQSHAYAGLLFDAVKAANEQEDE